MEYCIIMCRSLTNAQRAVKELGRENIHGRIAKAPQGMTPEGCSFGVKLRRENMHRALDAIKDMGIAIGRIYLTDSRGMTEEVEEK